MRDARLDLAAVRRMRERDYPNVLIARLIDENPGDFALAGATDGEGAHDERRVEALRALDREFGLSVTLAILRKVLAREGEAARPPDERARGDGPEGPGEDGGGDRFVINGTWIWERGDDAHEIRLMDANRYRTITTRDGRRQAPRAGQWELRTAEDGQQTLVLREEGREPRDLPLRAVTREGRDFLLLRLGEREFEYRRARG